MKLFHRRYSVGTCRPYSINVLHPGEESSQSVHLPLWPSGLSCRKLCRINSQWEDSLSKLHVGMSKWRSHRWSMRRGCTGVEGCFLPQGPAPFPGAIVLPVLLTGVPCILPVLVVPRLLLESGFYYPRLQLGSHVLVEGYFVYFFIQLYLSDYHFIAFSLTYLKPDLSCRLILFTSLLIVVVDREDQELPTSTLI